jgi:hypothetical protein
MSLNHRWIKPRFADSSFRGVEQRRWMEGLLREQFRSKDDSAFNSSAVVTWSWTFKSYWGSL